MNRKRLITVFFISLFAVPIYLCAVEKITNPDGSVLFRLQADPIDVPPFKSIVTKMRNAVLPPITMGSKDQYIIHASDGNGDCGYFYRTSLSYCEKHLTTDIKAGNDDTHRGYVRWDTTVIPDSFSITNIDMTIHVQDVNGSQALPCTVFNFANANPNTYSCEANYQFSNNAYFGAFTVSPGDTIKQVSLAPQAAPTAMATRLPLNWFAVGIKGDSGVNTLVTFAGRHHGQALAPRLDVLSVPPTATPTPTWTGLPTSTPTATGTGTSTPTYTPTPTGTPTSTWTITPTFMPTWTPTTTPTPTASPTATATYTACAAPVSSPASNCVQGTEYLFSWQDNSPCGLLHPPTVYYEAQNSLDPSFNSIADSSGLIGQMFHRFTSLRSGFTYYYRVRSLNGGSYSTWSDLASGSHAITQDNDAPTSSIIAADMNLTYCTFVFEIPFTMSDQICGTDFVELFYQRNFTGFQQYNGPFSSSPIIFDASITGGYGSYEFYTLATDVVDNTQPSNPQIVSVVLRPCNVTATPTPTGRPTSTPTSFFTSTPTITPTPTKTPSRTPTPRESFTQTPTFTPTITNTPRESATPTVTPTGSPITPTPVLARPLVMMAGYMSTQIRPTGGGTLSILAITGKGAGSEMVTDVRMLYQGQPTGLSLTKTDEDVFAFSMALGPPLPPAYILLELQALSADRYTSVLWPYLTVE